MTTRERLISTAAQLFRAQGYHATGIAEVLAAARVPKGSLYHHFPAGKADLARAAADFIAEVMLRIVDDAFLPAPSWQHGVATFCHKLAKLFERREKASACPISALLFDGPEEADFRAHAEATFARLIAAMAAHARRLGVEDADGAAELLLVAIEGGWTLARTRRNADVLRRLASRLFP